MIKRIHEHDIEIPDWRPGDELINEGLSFDEAFWKRLEYPKIWYDYNEDTKPFENKTVYDIDGKLISLSQEDSYTLRDLKEKDLHRRRYGVHMKNGDDIVWIAPDYFFFLQWFKHKDLPGSSGDFGGIRLIQNDSLQLWESVKHNPEQVGLIIPKIKKCGITYLFAAAFLNEALINQNWDLMMMSKDFVVGKASLFTFLAHGYHKLPYILKPAGGVRETQSEMKFSRPNKASKKLQGENYINSKLTLTKTKTGAFDAPVVKRGWLDELPKTWGESKVSPQEIMTKSIEAVKKQQVINGKLLVTSYMLEDNDRGFREFKEICLQSQLSTIKKGAKRTESGLILMPIYAYQSNEACFDKYGKCDEKEAARLRNEEFATKSSKKDIQSFKRQYPMNWGHIFDNTGSGSTFDNVRLSIRSTELEEEDKKGFHPYKEGNLVWKNSLWEEFGRPEGEFCEVEFEEILPHEKLKGIDGSLKIFHDLTENPNTSQLLNVPVLKNIREDGRLKPSDESLFVSTIDPTDYKLKSDVKDASLNASHGGFIFDTNINEAAGKSITDELIYEYNFRHEDPDKILEDMIKIVLYWGCYVIIEANKGWLVTEFKKHGLERFLILRQADGTLAPYNKYGDYNGGNKIITTDSKMIDVYCRSISRYIAEPKPGQIDRLQSLKTIPLIKQLMDFDPMDTRRYDLAVSFGYWRVGVENFTIWCRKREAKKPMTEGDSEKVLALISRVLS